MNKRIIGKNAEAIAADFLKKKGFRIIKRNFSCRLGEIDIIAKEKDEIVIVEVRSISSGFLLDPVESIGYRKISRLRRIAAFWLYLNRLQEARIRFDTISVIFRKNGEQNFFQRFLAKNNRAEIRHIKDAF